MSDIRTDGWVAMAAAVLVLLSSMWDPPISVG
jgi:hypothetical protein